VSDVIGIWEESKQRADKFAARGYTTLMIDLFNGDRVKKGDFESLDKNSWLANGRNGRGPHTPKEVDPIVQRGVSYLRKDLGFKHVGAAGYSFGARFLVRNLNAGIDAGYIAYPSFVKDDELAAITAPLSIAASETDTILTNEDRHRWEEILKENGNLYQINLYSGVVHGFYAAERDVDKVHEKFAQEHSFLQAVTFFDRWLA
jgi:dienelactone hydrolase